MALQRSSRRTKNKDPELYKYAVVCSHVIVMWGPASCHVMVTWFRATPQYHSKTVPCVANWDC